MNKSKEYVQGKPLMCLCCGQQMELKKYIPSTKKGNRGKARGYRIRKFWCDLCEVGQTIYADGGRDVGVYDREEEEFKTHTFCNCQNCKLLIKHHEPTN